MARDINTNKVSEACRIIDKNKTALRWLQQYGPHLDSQTSLLRLDTITAASCVGFREAQSAISDVATAMIKEIVAAATAQCQAKIDENSLAISAEVAGYEGVLS